MNIREPPAGPWLLIAVLTSTFPMAPAMAMRLYRGAVELERTGGGVEHIVGDLGVGELRRLGRDLRIGVLGGPGFEAELDTPEGKGLVRFILTRQGLARANLGQRVASDGGDRTRWN